MTQETVALRANLIKFLQRDLEFEIFDTEYLFNGATFQIDSSGSVEIFLANSECTHKSVDSITDVWLRNNCNKRKDQNKEKKATKKKKIANSSRLKPKIKKDPAYLSWLHNVHQPRCFVCGSFCGIELHHVKKTSSDEKDDHCVIPLCGDSCHRIGTIMSAHDTPVKFRAEYPIEVQKKFADNLYQQYKDRNGS